jgi:hypothetical protein
MTVVVNKLKFCVVIIAIHGNASFGKMLNKPNKWLKHKEKHLNRAKMHHNGLREPIDDVSKN